MNFLKQNSIFLLLLLIIGSILIFPGIRETLKNTFLPVAEIENHLKIEDEDFSIALKGINTKDTNLNYFKGKKVLFLNFWGTWCAPCLKEWPSIQKLYDSQKDKMDFVLIAMLDDEEKIRKFIQDNNYTVPVYIAESPISKKLLPKVFPTTYILDKNARILKKETSSKDWYSTSEISFINEITK